MNFLDEIYQTHLAIDDWLQSEVTQKQHTAVIPWPRMSELSDYAFFVLLFGQLEDYINQEFAQRIGPWQESAFEHRVNCLFENESAQAELIMDFYDLRCAVAHGHAEAGQMGKRIRIGEVYDNIQSIIMY